jgi:hypothetical protein
MAVAEPGQASTFKISDTALRGPVGLLQARPMPAPARVPLRPSHSRIPFATAPHLAFELLFPHSDNAMHLKVVDRAMSKIGIQKQDSGCDRMIDTVNYQSLLRSSIVDRSTT